MLNVLFNLHLAAETPGVPCGYTRIAASEPRRRRAAKPLIPPRPPVTGSPARRLRRCLLPAAQEAPTGNEIVRSLSLYRRPLHRFQWSGGALPGRMCRPDNRNAAGSASGPSNHPPRCRAFLLWCPLLDNAGPGNMIAHARNSAAPTSSPRVGSCHTE